MDDFIPVFIVAIVFIVIMLLVTAFISFPAPPMNITVSGVGDIGEVGYLTDYPSKTLDLKTFTVGETQEDNLKAIPQVNVYRNLITAHTEDFIIEVPEWYQTTQRGLWINFYIYEQSAGQFSRLVIKWNGLEVFNHGGAATEQSIFIDKTRVKGSNSLEIDADFNPWWFWATSTYTLKDFNVNLEYGPEKLIPFELLASELQVFNKGEVTFDASGGCDLIVRVNGIDIYGDRPDGEEMIEFTYQDVPITPGGNILAFIATDGICQFKDSEFKIYLVGNQVVVTRKFDMTKENHNLLGQDFTGKINYKIDNIMRTGSLVIKMNGRDLPVPTPRTGQNSVTFTQTDAQEGENQLSFSGTGAFDISDVVVTLER